MALDPREGLFEHTKFAGLRNNVGADEFGLDDLSVGLNIDLDDEARIRRRAGYGSVVVAGVDRCLWSAGAVCLGVGSNDLKLIAPDYSTITLRSGLSPLRPLSYAGVGGRVYYANGTDLGCVENGAHRTWGITPPSMPVAAATAGTMQPGLYQYAVTYLRADGQESGAGRAGTIELTDSGGISLSAISVSADPGVNFKVIYAASVGGETLYAAGVVANAETTFVIRETRMGVSPLPTQFLSPPPAGEHIMAHGGYILVAVNNSLYPSEPYAPELFDVRKAVRFSDKITILAPADDGVWVGTNSQVIWLPGGIPEKWEHVVKAEYGAIPYTATEADGEGLGDGSKSGQKITIFAAKTGTVCAIGNGGYFQNLTASRYAFSSMDVGASLVRRHRGSVQWIGTLQGAEVAQNAA